MFHTCAFDDVMTFECLKKNNGAKNGDTTFK